MDRFICSFPDIILFLTRWKLRQADIPNLKKVTAEGTWKISKCKIIQTVCLNSLKFIYKTKSVGKSNWIFTFFMYFLDYSDYFPVIANIDDNLATSLKQKLNGQTEEWYLKTKHTIRVILDDEAHHQSE